MDQEFRRRQFLAFAEELAGRLGMRYALRRGPQGRSLPRFQAAEFWIDLDHRMNRANFPEYKTVVALDPAGALDADLRLEVYPELPSHALPKFFGMEDHPVEDPHFDPWFIVQGNLTSARFASVLDPEIRRFFLEMRDVQPTLSAGEHEVSLTLHEMVIAEAALRSMFWTVTSITQRLRVRPVPPVQWGPVTPPEPRVSLGKAVPVCRVCGRSMTLFVVRCARCERPHHAECWSYAGVCSTFGCGGTERT